MGVAHALMRQGDATVEPQDVEWAVKPHRLFRLFVGKFLNPDRQTTQVLFEPARDRSQRAVGEILDVGERRRQAIAHPITPELDLAGASAHLV